MTVRFESVGRDKQSWIAEVPGLSDDHLIREIHKRQALRSQGIDFDWNETGDRAEIIVGGFRHVGKLEVMDGIKLTYQV